MHNEPLQKPEDPRPTPWRVFSVMAAPRPRGPTKNVPHYAELYIVIQSRHAPPTAPQFIKRHPESV
jgi:hypothetical protein